MSEYCDAYLWLQEEQYGEASSIQVKCGLPAGHQLMHMNTEMNGYCRKPHDPIVMWNGDDSEEDRLVAQEVERTRSRYDAERITRLAEQREQRRAWQASDAARQQFITEAARWMGKTAEEVAPLVERCPCDADLCTGWRLKLGEGG